MRRPRKTNDRKWSAADYERFAAYYDAHPDKTLKECRRDLGCGEAALQIAMPLSRRWKVRLYT